VPSPLAGEGSMVLQRILMGEGVKWTDVIFAKSPSPLLLR